MKITCVKCGHINEVNGLGRKRVEMPLEKVYERIREASSIRDAANKLDVSVGWLYKHVGREQINALRTAQDRCNRIKKTYRS